MQELPAAHKIVHFAKRKNNIVCLNERDVLYIVDVIFRATAPFIIIRPLWWRNTSLLIFSNFLYARMGLRSPLPSFLSF